MSSGIYKYYYVSVFYSCTLRGNTYFYRKGVLHVVQQTVPSVVHLKYTSLNDHVTVMHGNPLDPV